MQEQISLHRGIRKALTEELEKLSLEQLNYVPPTHNNNIFWNITHCIAVQQVLCYRLSGLPLRVDKSIITDYSRGTHPTKAVDLKMVDEVHKLLLTSVDWLEQDLEKGIFKDYKPYTVAFGTHLTNVQQAITFNNVHEGIHCGYLLALKKLL
ncbi:MAG: DinB family protein [Aureispira sp.]